MQMYENMGKNLLVSILDIFNKNPYSRISEQQMQLMRREIAQNLAKMERFRKEEPKLFLKTKKVSEII